MNRNKMIGKIPSVDTKLAGGSGLSISLDIWDQVNEGKSM